MSDRTYCVTAHCNAPADEVLAFMANGIALGGWALGCFNTEQVDERGTVRGRTLATGDETYVRPIVHPEQGIVVYEVAYGENVNNMTPWIWAIVRPADFVGCGSDSSLVSLIAWRIEGTSDEDWNAVCRYHDAEILLIKGQVERRARA
jgi:hypothetical protein